MTHSRREVLAAAAGTVFASVLLPLRATAIPQLRVTGIELLSVRATSRTVWLIVRLRTDGGLEGLGEETHVARTMRRGYVTVHVTVGRSEEGDSRKLEGFWLLGLDSNQQPSG
jgi:L-alanine-DL-glutamate epimerase-like enolase superfamily enzyme